MKRRVATDWLKLKEEYLRSTAGLNALADRHGIGRKRVQTLAAKQGWAAEKRAAKAKATQGEAASRKQPTQQPPASTQRLARLKAIGDQLTEQLARAAGEQEARVSCEGLHKLSITLKNLSDLAKAGNPDEQSVALVAELMKKLDEEAAREEAPHAVPDP